MCIVFFPNIFGFCFCKNVGIKSRPDLKSLFPQFFYARELFKYVCSTSKFKQKRYKNIYLAHGIPATSSETTNPEFFARKFVGLHFFRKKLQIVFLCKLNSYTYLVYFDSRKKNSLWSDWSKHQENFDQNCVKW